MRTFCVPSHHNFSSDPLNKQGVLLTTEMLKEGIWGGGRTGTTTQENTLSSNVELHRVESQPSFLAALSGLLATQPPDVEKYTAVVSLRWCSLYHRLMLTKRVWLAIYHQDTEVVRISHSTEERALYSFVHYFERTDLEFLRNATFWQEHFLGQIRLHWQTVVQNAHQAQKESTEAIQRATAALA